MTLSRKDFSVTRTNGGADVFRLAGFLRTTPSMNAFAVNSHSVAISRSQPQYAGSSRTEVG